MTTTPHNAHDTALTHALAAAARGLPVIPLSRTKLPAVRSPHRGERRRVRCRGECGHAGHGIHDATADPDAVRALFAAAPWATGYALACGRPPHHLVGLDLDVKHDVDGIAALDELATAHGFTVPASITVSTPTGGRHLWLTGPPGPTVPNSAGRLTAGVDVRGRGGYLVGPGSLTVRGTYTLTPGTEHHRLRPAPEQLLNLLIPPAPAPPGPAAVPVAGRRAVALVRFVLDAPPGRRNDRLYWAACRAHETGAADQLAAALIDAAQSIGLPEAEARATVASAARRTARRSE